MKIYKRIAIVVISLAVASMATLAAGSVIEGSTRELARESVVNPLEGLQEVPLVRGAKTNGYTVKDLGIDGIEVSCRAVVGAPTEGKYESAEAGYSATAKATAQPQGSASLGTEGLAPESTTAPKEGVTAGPLHQGTAEVKAEVAPKSNANSSSAQASVVSNGSVTVLQKVEFKDGNATFRLCYANLKHVTVVFGK